jgi:hypothetical protein
VLPLIGPLPSDAIVGDCRGLFERDALPLGEGVHHAPGSRRHARGLFRQGVAEAAGEGGYGVRFGPWHLLGFSASAVKGGPNFRVP